MVGVTLGGHLHLHGVRPLRRAFRHRDVAGLRVHLDLLGGFLRRGALRGGGDLLIGYAAVIARQAIQSIVGDLLRLRLGPLHRDGLARGGNRQAVRRLGDVERDYALPDVVTAAGDDGLSNPDVAVVPIGDGEIAIRLEFDTVPRRIGSGLDGPASVFLIGNHERGVIDGHLGDDEGDVFQAGEVSDTLAPNACTAGVHVTVVAVNLIVDTFLQRVRADRERRLGHLRGTVKR